MINDSRFKSATPSRFSEPQIEGFLERHGCAMLRIARRFSANHADAEDAYQRGLEVLLTKAPAADESGLAAWLATVVRNEALMIVRKQRRVIGAAFEDVGEHWSAESMTPDEQLVEREQTDHGREALSRLSADQARCLLLRADGMSYDEIGETTGFSYAKTHRCLSEGRKRFHRHVRAIDAGEECLRVRPLLTLVADGEASDTDRRAVRRHIRGCLGCRAELRDYRATPRQVAALFPIAAALPQGGGALDRFTDAINSIVASLQERVVPLAAGGTHGAELGMAKKAIAVTAATATLLAGGTAVHKLTNADERAAGDRSPASEQLPTGPTTQVTGSSGAVTPNNADDAKSAERLARDATKSDVDGRRASAAPDRADPGSGNQLLEEAPVAADPPVIENDGVGVSPDEAAQGGLAP